jgi:hypothetical protein
LWKKRLVFERNVKPQKIDGWIDGSKVPVYGSMRLRLCNFLGEMPERGILRGCNAVTTLAHLGVIPLGPGGIDKYGSMSLGNTEASGRIIEPGILGR